jgi:hypothetical protein
VPISYALFVTISTLALMIAEGELFNFADGIIYFSIVYGASFYLWIPGTWLLLSILGGFAINRRSKDHRFRPKKPSRRSHR